MGWNLDEMIAYARKKGRGAEIFGRMFDPAFPVNNHSAKKTVLNMCIKANMNELIGENEFDRELMINILEFSNQMNNYEKSDLDYIKKEELYLLEEISFDAPGKYVEYNRYFEEPLTFIGYPTEEINGSLAASGLAVAINANCKHKEVAWEFIRTLLTEECQTSWFGGIPIRKDAMERRYEIDIEYYMRKNDSLTADAFAEQLETVTEMIAGIDSAVLEAPVHAIIREEADYFFEGARTVEETVDIIASRVMLYINENK